jgi:hypothetical protein
MSTRSSGEAPLVRRLPAASADWHTEPFLHVDGDTIYNPLTDRTLTPSDRAYFTIRQLHAAQTTIEAVPSAARGRLAAEGWIVIEEPDLSRRFLLKYVSLEAHTVCNQACYFCPVSLDPRKAYYMPMTFYEQIVSQLADYRPTLEAVFMINYNEPTADSRFLDQVRCLMTHGLPAAVLTNATGLTPSRVDALIALGGLRFLSVNLSTLDRERYRQDRGADQLPMVLRHLEYAKDRPVAERMDIVVLGRGDDVHRRDFKEIRALFSGSRFDVKSFEVMDRAGRIPLGLRPPAPHARLCGCENVGSRPLQHLHITPHGKCVLCCEDYDEKYVVGDLTQETVAQVLTGDALAILRRWAYGLEDAPADFMCRKCVFARTE